mmetsp:Transcript_74474/g.206844  ORF Transcript_74474/g.206844 Transcript_74474/m.206844 type:complete len:230 (+) Transcript_74474:86-775(+)
MADTAAGVPPTDHFGSIWPPNPNACGTACWPEVKHKLVIDSGTSRAAALGNWAKGLSMGLSIKKRRQAWQQNVHAGLRATVCSVQAHFRRAPRPTAIVLAEGSMGALAEELCLNPSTKRGLHQKRLVVREREPTHEQQLEEPFAAEPRQRSGEFPFRLVVARRHAIKKAVIQTPHAKVGEQGLHFRRGKRGEDRADGIGRRPRRQAVSQTTSCHGAGRAPTETSHVERR